MILSLVALAVPLTQVANATHGGCVLDVRPEADTNATGTTHTITAILLDAPSSTNDTGQAFCDEQRSQATNVDFEVIDQTGGGTYTGGTGAIDAAETPNQPDMTCTIASNAGGTGTQAANQCSVTYTRTNEGTDHIVGFVDEDANNNNNATADYENEPPATDDPDSVDTVIKSWVGPANQIIDCGPENDVNPTGTQHTITCEARSATGGGGTGLQGVDIDYQVTGANPTGPQHGCTTAADNPNTQTNEQGTCSFTYTGNNAGNDTIQAFVNQDGNHTNNDCGAEATGDAEDDDFCDQVEKTFQNRVATFLDVEPETDTNPNGTTHTLTATFTDQFGDPIELSEGQLVDFEIISGPNANLTPGFRDFECPSNNPTQGGTCTATYQDNPNNFDANNATDVICGYISTDGDDDQYDPNGTPADGGDCDTETPNETEQGVDPNNQNIAGNEGNDQTDVVLKTWTAPVQQPATQVNAEPETDTNPVGTQHTIGVFAGNANNQGTTATNIRGDILPGSANASQQTAQAEINCVQDNTAGPGVTFPQGQAQNFECTYTGQNAGTDTIRIFADSNGNNIFDQGEPFDDVTKTWSGAAFALQLTPDQDTATAGTCNEFTARVTDQQGNPVVGQIVDVQQVLQGAATEPNETRELAFCNPQNAQGPNPTGQGGTAFGDVTGNNQGQAAGQAGRNSTVRGEVGPTNNNGEVTFGITINAVDANTTVQVRAFVDVNDDNDQFDAGEPTDVSTKTWTPGGTGSVTGINAEPETATNPNGTQHQVTVTVTGAGGPIQGVTPNSIIVNNASGRPQGDVADANAGTSPNAAGNQGNFNAYNCTVTNAQGVSTCTFQDPVNTPAGTDTIVFYVNQAGGGTAGPDAGEPQDAVQKTWTPGPQNLAIDVRCAGAGTQDDQDVGEQGGDNAATPDCANPLSDQDEVFTAIVTNPQQNNVGVQNIRVDFSFGQRTNGNAAGANNSTNDATLNATPGGQVGTNPNNLQTFCLTDATGRCSVTLTNATPQAGDTIEVIGVISGQTVGGPAQDGATKQWQTGVVNQGGTITLTPRAATNQVGTPHTVTATVRNQFGQPVQGANVDFSITQGPNAGLAQAGMTDAVTDANGVATFTYTSNATGTDEIRACSETGGTENDTCGPGEPTATAFKTWQTGPVTTNAVALDMDADDGAAVNNSGNPGQCELTTGGADTNRESTATNQIDPTAGGQLAASNFHRICAAAFQNNQAGNNGRLAGAQITFTISGPGRIFAANANGNCATNAQPAAGTTVTVTADNNGYAFACLYSQQVGRTTVTASSGNPAQTATGTKDWTVSPSTARFIQLCHGDIAGTTCDTAPATNEPGDEHEMTARVTDAQGNPVANVSVQFRETGPGIFTPQGGGTANVLTDANGLAAILLTSDVEGTSTVVAEIDPGQTNAGRGAGTDECERPAGTNNQPAAGNCTSQTLTKVWEEPEEEFECNDGIDNDGDTFVDFGDDPGCTSEDDDSEDPFNQPPLERVPHERSISIRFTDGTGARNNGLVVFGRVRVGDGFNDCMRQVPINIQRRVNGRWVTKKATDTNRRGRYAVEIFDQASRYRAVAVRHAIEDLDAGQKHVCLRAVKEKRHRHRR